MRKLMVTVAAVAGLTLVTGCQRGSDVQEQRRDVAEAQQELGETQREAHQEVAQTTAEARQEMGQEVREAQQELNQEQRELAQEQREQVPERAEGGSGMAAAPTTVQGSLQSKSGDELVLSTQDGRQLRLMTDDETRVMQNNQEVKMDAVGEGSEVRASYVNEDGKMMARDITVTKPMLKKK